MSQNAQSASEQAFLANGVSRRFDAHVTLERYDFATASVVTF
jgi:hypothetical protein